MITFTFQSTLPLRGATNRWAASRGVYTISIHAPLTGSDRWVLVSMQAKKISIHAPLTGSDRCNQGPSTQAKIISIHAPLTGSDGDCILCTRGNLISIHAPLTGSDCIFPRHRESVPDFNPRSPYGERRRCLPESGRLGHFNPRSPYGERPVMCRFKLACARFQSTLPLRGATQTADHHGAVRKISIHAPLTGSD